MTASPSVSPLARLLAMLVPAGAMATALVAQYGFALAPCEMCWWQRYAHIAAFVAALLALVVRDPRASRLLFWLAVAGIAASGLIGGYHAGVEYHWWQGITTCSTIRLSGGDALDAILNAPVIRCDVPAWTLFGISMAGYNFIGSLGAAAVIGLLARRGR
ncbi:disulfide bond formation protein B [Novosphingobium sp. Fuku2-ISO-50]|jgi:disulfide bond formation protein DsbB|uniref:disulfide bond formation protein B n=1 Tax=Novosphingobium sp. Fuku2-ISO-50 TaxID=1739114 RepID=UPI00076C1BA5|nr:disulfide bond formation protein B [Novosphingobium sp. Fuku2-ISO-50]KUR77347.1 disulfide bond formation protein [Novosphingobium sp. Fuku2-ISO-50]